MKRRTKFSEAFKEDIFKGNITVETRDGRPVQIVAWDLKGNYPILARYMVKRTNYEGDESWEEERPFAYNYSGKKEDSFVEDATDLFVVYEESNEFEEAIANLVYDNPKDINWDAVSKFSEKLMNIARKEIISELPHWKPVKKEIYLKDLHLVKKVDGTFTTAYDHTIRPVDDEYNGPASEKYISVQELLDKLVTDDD